MAPALETLPPELLFNIVSYLDPFSCTKPCRKHPIDTVAATSKFLRSIVQEYSRGLFVKHAGRAPKGVSARNCRVAWRKWLSTTCQICKKKSKRRSILDPDMTCCRACDKLIPKMTMTTAITQHGLSKLDLFTPNILHPNLPPLLYGSYVCNGGKAMMFSESDVLARKKLIHGMLGEPSKDDRFLKRRCAAHGRITHACSITFYAGQWRTAYKFVIPGAKKPRLRTKEAKSKYVKEQLEKEWAALGVEGYSVDTAIDMVSDGDDGDDRGFDDE